MTPTANRKILYQNILTELFFGVDFCAFESDQSRPEMRFTTDQVDKAREKFQSERLGNVGDVTFAFRSKRQAIPDRITKTAPKGYVWTVVNVSSGLHAFKLDFEENQFSFGKGRSETSVLDATPEIVKQFALFRDEQALLTIVRYNRLVDLFLGLTAYSIQNHMKTAIKTIEGRSKQIEIDEVYVGVDQDGHQYLIPVQARRNGEGLSSDQIMSDILFCQQQIDNNFPDMRFKSVGVEFTNSGDMHRIAFAEFELQNGHVRVKRDRVYLLKEIGEFKKPDQITRLARRTLLSRADASLGT